MSGNQEVVERFYNAFQRLDYTTMQSCYSEEIIFNDPAFGILRGDDAKAMWEMLCRNAKDFSLTYSNIQLLDHEYTTCQWVASYTFSKTGRKVVNRIKAHMRIKDGKIIEHTDQFDIWKWSRQALGISGWLLGWSGYMKSKIRVNAHKSLDKFISSRLS
jgi:ketosteroid isomerase-like protein